MRVHPLAPVIGLDIDGTLANWHSHFVWFLRKVYYPYSQYTLSKSEWFEPQWPKTHRGEFDLSLHMRKENYRAAKLAYRQGGLKRCLPPYEDVEKTVQEIRAMGVQVWICTTRPWLSLNTVDPDTTYWLEHNAGKVDGLIYGEDKYLDLIDIVGRPRILGVIDDLPEVVERAQSLGLRSALRRSAHNQWWLDEDANRNQTTHVFTRTKDIASVVSNWKQIHRG